jgi:hypothetical protein
MPLKIGLFACELLYPDTPPHLGMCLFVKDLREAGVECRPYLVNIAEAERISTIAREEQLDLVAMESIFPLQAVRRIKQLLGKTPLLLGGVNALTLFLHSPAEYAVVGPGRRAMMSLVDALSGRGTLDQVPGLFHRVSGGKVDHSGIYGEWDVRAEILPYRPEFRWTYVGPHSRSGVSLKLPAVVPEFGCHYARPSSENVLYRDLPPHPVLQDPSLLPRAREALARHMEAGSRGCSFCVFRNQETRLLPVADTVDLVLEQARHLRTEWKTRDMYIQSENPFRFLEPLVQKAIDEGIPPERLYIRTTPALLVRHRESLERCITRLSATGGKLQIMQLGFESFVQRHLDIFNKGATVEDNIKACRILRDLQRKFGPQAVEGYRGHGLILLHPWCRLEELRENLAIIEREAPFLRTAISVGSRLTLYNEFTPIFRKAMADRLVRRSNVGFGWDFRFEDPRMEVLIPLTGRMTEALVRLAGDRRPGDADLSRRISMFSQFDLLGAALEWIDQNGPDTMRIAEKELPAELREVVQQIGGRWADAPGFPRRDESWSEGDEGGEVP